MIEQHCMVCMDDIPQDEIVCKKKRCREAIRGFNQAKREMKRKEHEYKPIQ